MWSLHKRSIKLYSSQTCINCSRNAVYSLRLKSCFKRCSICLPFCWTTHFRRCHLLILRSMNFWDSARHSTTIDCFSCSTVSNTHRNTLAAAGLPTLHNLPGSKSALFAGHIAGSIKVTFHSAGSWHCFWQLCHQSEYYYLKKHLTICHKLSLMCAKNY